VVGLRFALPEERSRQSGHHGLRRPRDPLSDEETAMLHWAVVFFVIAIVAALFGFGGIAASATGIAKILFFAFLVLAVVSMLVGRRIRE
jgi:uncharacterized membrane protein YtjA (UPF0391 family)